MEPRKWDLRENCVWDYLGRKWRLHDFIKKIWCHDKYRRRHVVKVYPRIVRIEMAMEGEIKPAITEHFEWNVENEIHLFEAMIGYKPVGVHKHFHMACICEKFETLLGKSVSPNIIWDHLQDMYDLAALDKKESVQFPNELEEFALPASDFSELIAKKLTKTETSNEPSSREDKSTTKSAKEYSHSSESSSKKEKKSDHEENASETEKKDVDDKEQTDAKKGKVKKEEKSVGKRGKRSLKDKKNEEDNAQVSTPSSKKGDEESSTAQTNNKKGKRIIGKRSLRSRADDTSSKCSTPPPAKRARRI